MRHVTVRALASACLGLIALLLLWPEQRSSLSQPLDGRLELVDMTWVQVRTAVEAGFTTVIVPSGGIEQNGEHMVLAKHDHIVRANARAIAEMLGKTLVAPVISFVPEGDPEHPDGNLKFPGTIGLRTSTFEKVLEDVAESLKLAGFKTICLISDHGQSLAPQQAVARRLSERWSSAGVRVISVDEYYADQPQRDLLFGRGETDATIGSHAGLQDTSELMAAYPAGVNLALASPSAPLREQAGGSGDPRKATPELGRELLLLKVQGAVARIRRELAR